MRDREMRTAVAIRGAVPFKQKTRRVNEICSYAKDLKTVPLEKSEKGEYITQKSHTLSPQRNGRS